ncbi:MAG: hypothetical protein WCO29_19635 [Nostocales cyanobacterium ELA583]|jgi:hypothetical protein
MTQRIQFSIIKVFSEKFLSEFDGETNPFVTGNIYECLKGLFKGTEKNSSEYVEKYFENVELNYLSITEVELEKIDKTSLKELKYIFDRETNSLSLVDEELWINLEKIIFNELKKCLDNNEDMKKSLKYHCDIIHDYQKLLGLFHKRILFINIF